MRNNRSVYLCLSAFNFTLPTKGENGEALWDKNQREKERRRAKVRKKRRKETFFLFLPSYSHPFFSRASQDFTLLCLLRAFRHLQPKQRSRLSSASSLPLPVSALPAATNEGSGKWCWTYLSRSSPPAWWSHPLRLPRGCWPLACAGCSPCSPCFRWPCPGRAPPGQSCSWRCCSPPHCAAGWSRAWTPRWGPGSARPRTAGWWRPPSPAHSSPEPRTSARGCWSSQRGSLSPRGWPSPRRPSPRWTRRLPAPSRGSSSRPRTPPWGIWRTCPGPASLCRPTAWWGWLGGRSSGWRPLPAWGPGPSPACTGAWSSVRWKWPCPGPRRWTPRTRPPGLPLVHGSTGSGVTSQRTPWQGHRRPPQHPHRKGRRRRAARGWWRGSRLAQVGGWAPGRWPGEAECPPGSPASTAPGRTAHPPEGWGQWSCRQTES